MSTDPVPAYFNLRYVLWFLWSHAIFGLAAIQLAFQAITLNPDVLPHNVVHWCSIANMVLIGLIALIKGNNPVGPAPTRST